MIIIMIISIILYVLIKNFIMLEVCRWEEEDEFFHSKKCSLSLLCMISSEEIKITDADMNEHVYICTQCSGLLHM